MFHKNIINKNLDREKVRKIKEKLTYFRNNVINEI